MCVGEGGVKPGGCWCGSWFSFMQTTLVPNSFLKISPCIHSLHSIGSFEPGLASCGVSCTPPLRLAPHVKEMRLQLRTGHPRSAFAETGADSTD